MYAESSVDKMGIQYYIYLLFGKVVSELTSKRFEFKYSD